jgi:hypothetical protein
MQSFVHRNDGVAGDSQESDRGDVKRRNHDDLKVPLPDNRTAHNSRPSEVNAKTSKRPVSVKMEYDANHAHVPAKRLSGGHGAFYDTDASSIDQTSTVASVNGEVVDATVGNEGEDCSSDMNEEQEAEDDEDDPGESELRAYASEPDEAVRRAYDLQHAIQTRTMQLPLGTVWPTVKGDSYPSTTSGNPSVSEVPNGGAAQNVDPQRGIQTMVYNLPNRHSNQRRPFTAAAPHSTQHVQTPAYPAHVMQNQAKAAFTGVPNGTTQDPTSQIAPGFTYAQPPQPQQKPVGASTRNPPQKAVSRGPPPTTSTNTVQPTTDSTSDEKSHNLFSEPQQQHGHKQRTRDVLQNVPNTAQNRQLPQNSIGQQDQRVRFDAGTERHPSRNEETDHVPGDGRNTHHREPEKELDYDIQELYGMDYNALKKEPFDVDPNTHETHYNEQHDAITERMAAAKGMQAEAQAQFFNGLSIIEWEEGGDWFLDQFSTVLNQLKDVRQQRRKAAQAYEDEIEGRFEAVGQKRKQIDVALSEMKESGGKVLQGTPKKSKT